MSRLRVVHVHSYSRGGGGADIALEVSLRALREMGIEAVAVTRQISEMRTDLSGKFAAFALNCFHTREAKAQAQEILEKRPDVVHVHYVFPMFSAWIIDACSKSGVPVVMTCHSFGPTCPTYQHLRRGKICTRCRGGHVYWCALTNCRDNLLESLGYAARSAAVARFSFFKDKMSHFITPTPFVKEWYVESGFPESRLSVVPYGIDMAPQYSVDPGKGEYVAFAGRFSPEKGIECLLEAARISKLPVRLAGDWSNMPWLRDAAPSNAVFVGKLGRQQIVEFYRNARFLVVPSIWFETLGLVAAEAMLCGLPVVASRIGALADVVDHNCTGILFEPGNTRELAEAMTQLWNDTSLTQKLGRTARDRAVSLYDPPSHARKLSRVYESVLG